MRRSQVIATAALSCALLAVPLARSAGSTTSGTLPAEKLAMLERLAKAQADALAAPHAAKDLAVTAAASVPEPAWLSGIIDSGQAPLPGSSFEISNQWHDILGAEHVNVYAGAERDNPEVGVIVVDVTPLDPTRATASGGIYPTPEQAGAVSIVEAAGTKLVLLSARGARFIFDVATRTYL